MLVKGAFGSTRFSCTLNHDTISRNPLCLPLYHELQWTTGWQPEKKCWLAFQNWMGMSCKIRIFSNFLEWKFPYFLLKCCWKVVPWGFIDTKSALFSGQDLVPLMTQLIDAYKFHQVSVSYSCSKTSATRGLIVVIQWTIMAYTDCQHHSVAAPISLTFHSKFKLAETTFCCNSHCGHQISTNFCTHYYHTAAVVCAKFWCDPYITIW